MVALISFLKNLDLETLFEFTAILKCDDCDDSVLLLACSVVGFLSFTQLYRVYVFIDDVKEAEALTRE